MLSNHNVLKRSKALTFSLNINISEFLPIFNTSISAQFQSCVRRPIAYRKKYIFVLIKGEEDEGKFFFSRIFCISTSIILPYCRGRKRNTTRGLYPAYCFFSILN